MFKDGLLNGKRALISGGGTGLGKAMGHRFMELGADLVICGRREELLHETAGEFAEEFRRAVEVHQCDIRDAEAVDEMVEAAFQTAPIDILVNNAGGISWRATKPSVRAPSMRCSASFCMARPI